MHQLKMANLWNICTVSLYIAIEQKESCVRVGLGGVPMRNCYMRSQMQNSTVSIVKQRHSLPVFAHVCESVCMEKKMKALLL